MDLCKKNNISGAGLRMLYWSLYINRMNHSVVKRKFYKYCARITISQAGIMISNERAKKVPKNLTKRLVRNKKFISGKVLFRLSKILKFQKIYMNLRSFSSFLK